MSGMRVIGRLIAVFAIVLFVTLFPLVMLAYNAQAAAMSAGFLNSIAGDSRLFEAALSEAAEGLARDVPTEWETRDMPIAQLNAPQWEKILRTVTPPAMLQRLTRDALEEFAQWARYGGTFGEDVIVPYGEIRRNLVNDPQQTVLRTVTEAQPLCAAGQEPLGDADDLIPQCRPASSDLEAFYQALSRRWAQNPERVWQQLWPSESYFYTEDITVAELIRRESAEDWQRYGREWQLPLAWGLSLARGLVVLLVSGGVVATLLIIALLAARNLPEALRWAGAPLLLAGLFTLGWGLLMWAGTWIGPWLSITVTDVPYELQSAVRSIAASFTQRLSFGMSWQGVLLAVIGMVLWGSSFVIRRAARGHLAMPLDAQMRSVDQKV